MEQFIAAEQPTRMTLGNPDRFGEALRDAKGSLAEVATERFSKDVLASQSGIELLEVGSADSLLARVGSGTSGPARRRALGEAKGVLAVFVGRLKVSNVKPSGLFGLAEGHVVATVSAELAVRLLATKSGGALWRANAVARDRW